MDLTNLLRTVRRHWKIVAPIAVLTAVLLVWAVAFKQVDYEAKSFVVLIKPKAAPVGPDGEPILITPNGRADNPFEAFGDLRVVVGIVARAVGSDVNRQALVDAGVDPRFEIVPAFGDPTAEITALGSSESAARSSADQVAASFIAKLAEAQKAQGVDPEYNITALPPEQPNAPRAKLNSKVRLAVGILAVGGLLALFAVSLAEARRRNSAPAEAPGEVTPEPTDAWTDQHPIPATERAEPPPWGARPGRAGVSASGPTPQDPRSLR